MKEANSFLIVAIALQLTFITELCMLPQLVIRHKINYSGTGSWKTTRRNYWTEMQAKALWGYSEYSINYHFSMGTTRHYQRKPGFAEAKGRPLHLFINQDTIYHTKKYCSITVLYKSTHGRSCIVCHSYCFFKGPWVHVPELSDQALTLKTHGRCQPLFIHIISSTSSGKKKKKKKPIQITNFQK